MENLILRLMAIGYNATESAQWVEKYMIENKLDELQAFVDAKEAIMESISEI